MRLAGLMGGASLFAGCHLFAENAPVPEYIAGAPDVDPVETLAGVEVKYTVCALCPGNCGIACRVAAGNLVKIGGNPYSPVATGNPLPFGTRLKESLTHSGSICAIGGSGVQTLYNPFRVARPLKRVGPRGSGKWEALTWKQAIAEIVEGGNLFGEGRAHGLKDLKEAKQGAALLVGPADWGSLSFLKRFVGAFPGAALLRDPGAVLEWAARMTADSVFGPETGPVAVNYGSARSVLSFGDAPLDSGVPIVSIAREIAQARVDHVGFNWAVIDPRLSTSASKADLWVPVIPGKDRELILGIMRSLAEDHGTRITTPSKALENTFMQSSVEDYARQAGVSSAAVRRLARMMADEGPRSAALPGRGILAQPGGLETAQMVLALNLMVGSSPEKGALTACSDSFLRRAQEKLLGTNESDAGPILYGDPVGALVLWRSDPVYDDPGSASGYFGDRSKVPLFVAIDHEITETSAHADYILPDTTYLERWDICASPPSVSQPGFGVRMPVVGAFDSESKRYVSIVPEARLMEEIVLSLADALELPAFKSLATRGRNRTWAYYEKALTAVLESMKEAGYPVESSRVFLRDVVLRGGLFVAKLEPTQKAKPPARISTFDPPDMKPVDNTSSPEADSLLLITYSLPFHRSPNAGLNSWLLEILPENKLLINLTASGTSPTARRSYSSPSMERPSSNAKRRWFLESDPARWRSPADSVIPRPAHDHTPSAPLRLNLRKPGGWE
jgi:anaerobic selenocysteine-containing dehydrogenase